MKNLRQSLQNHNSQLQNISKVFRHPQACFHIPIWIHFRLDVQLQNTTPTIWREKCWCMLPGQQRAQHFNICWTWLFSAVTFTRSYPWTRLQVYKSFYTTPRAITTITDPQLCIHAWFNESSSLFVNIAIGVNPSEISSSACKKTTISSEGHTIRTCLHCDELTYNNIMV